MSTPTRYVVFDLETNAEGADPSEHEIIQIGGVIGAGTDEVDSFESLVRPEQKLAARITDLTGLEYGDLAHAPPIAEVLGRFLEWAGDLPLVAHNGSGYDFPVLDSSAARARLTPPSSPRLDTLELAHLIFPRAGSHIPGIDGSSPPPSRRLDDLAALYGLPARHRHDALVDSRLTRSIMLKLLEELDRSSPVRRLQRWILGVAGHPWARFVTPEGQPPSLAAVVPQVPVPERAAPTGRFDIGEVVRSFRSGGALMTGKREPREQQARMAHLVCKTFAGSGYRRMMIEAPTGTGKTLAYLVPAIESARAFGYTSVVTPHSRVLQDQILGTLQQLRSEIGPFTTVVLKGRQNYISLEALDAELTGLEEESPGNPTGSPMAMALAILCGWVSETPSGDWADLRTRAIENRLAELRFLRWKLRVDSPPGLVRSPLDKLDFHRRALQNLNTAHVAVLNHALLATGPDLGKGEFNLVIDEAHDLEDSVTSAATVSVSAGHLERLCDALWNGETRRGLAGRLAVATGAGLRDPKINAMRRAAERARTSIKQFTNPLTGYVRDRTGVTREEATRYGASYRIRRGVDNGRSDYRNVLRAGRDMQRALRRIATTLDDFSVPADLSGRYRRYALEEELARLGRESLQAAELVEAVLAASRRLRLFDDDQEDLDVSEWINIAEVSFATDASRERFDTPTGSEPSTVKEPAGRWRWSLRRSPLTVAGLLTDLWDRSRSVVLTSATLRVGDNFSYLIGRLGLGTAGSTVIDSPFENLSEQHLLLLTDYLPAPRGGLIDRFTEVEATEIPRLCTASDGGTLALMTSRARLESVREHARPHLEKVGIELLAQGDAPSPVLVERMRSDRNDRPACLLGLRRFWEGIDIPGDALRLLIIEKIPFDSIGDPLVSARTELLELQQRDPFACYLVPRAAIAFAQGVGRLIRTADDVGVTAVLDNRLRRPVPYRDVLLGSLPGPPGRRNIDTPAQAYRSITTHLGLDLDEERQERINRIPAVPTLSQTFTGLGTAVSAGIGTAGGRLEQARKWLGFERWRPGQYEIMTRFMQGEDMVAVLPTGSGKSVTYQIPALVSPGVTLVVSPLIALMRDQVDNLRSRGVTEAAAVYAGVAQAEQEAILRAATSGYIKLLYVSPERLWSPLFRSWLADVNLARIAVDEAHCISMWGHSFRPEYSIIPRAIAEVAGKRLPVLAVTATATPKVLEDIRSLLGLELSSAPLIASVNRPEIRYYVERCADKRERDLQVARVVESFRHRSAIVYVPTRRDTTRLSGLLRLFGHRVRPYNGAMEYSERQHTEDAFRHGEIDVVVATKAFGLGIDKPDIALIVHLEMPASIEEYVQETGRVARGAWDGTGPGTGTAVLLVTPRDCRIHEFFVRSSTPELDYIYAVWGGLRPGYNYLEPVARTGGAAPADTAKDNARALALHYLDQVGLLTRHRDFVLRGRITITEDTRQLMEGFRIRNPSSAAKADRLLQLAREKGGEYRSLQWSSRLGMSPGEMETILFELQKEDICGFTGWKYGWTFERIPGVEPDRDRLRNLIRHRREAVRGRAQQAQRFARRAHSCRRYKMLRYLGETEPDFKVCGGCDACTPDLPRPWRNVSIRAEGVQEAVQETATVIILMLIDDVEGGNWSRRNLVRTLRAESRGAYELPERLRMHGCFGRLEMLEPARVEDRIDELIDDGHLEEVQPDGRDYLTLRVTEKGRRRLRNYGR